MKSPASLPRGIHDAPFSVRAALEAGVPAQRLRRADLAAPFHGVRASASEDTSSVVCRCSAYRTIMRPHTFFSHSTAAALYGVPLPRRLAEDTVLHVSCVVPQRAPKGKGIRGHALSHGPALRTVDGFPVPAPAEVWCQLAAMLTIDELVIAGDALVCRQNPLCEASDLDTAAAAASARPGVRRLRAAVELVRPRTDSAMETVVRLAIVRSGLPEPDVNYAIADRSGRIVASGDLVYAAERLVIEYDGDHHRTDPTQYQTDIDRLYRIQALGWTVLRISKEHMRDHAGEAVRRIRHALTTIRPDTP